jgi:hypothetical protein
MARTLLMGAVAVLAACAPQQSQFTLVPQNHETAPRDQIECEAMARSGGASYVYQHPALSTFFGAATVADAGMRDLYARCLQSRGWSLHQVR